MTADDDWSATLAGLEFTDLAPETVRATETCLLDHFACALVGLTTPWIASLREAVADRRTVGATTRLYGCADPVPPDVAALILGSAGHAVELDDVDLPALVHPGSTVCATAVAVGTAVHAPGTDVVAAIVAGYQAMVSLGRALGTEHNDLGFHSTALHGAVGAAVTAARLIDRDTVGDAVSLAVSFGSGIKAFTHGPGQVKRLHPGRAAEAGILAARLAQHGLPGPQRALTGPFGYLRVYGLGAEPDVDTLLAVVHGRPAVETVRLKQYPACFAVHGAVSAAVAVATDITHGIAGGIGEVDGVRSIEIGVCDRIRRQNDNADPADVMSAQYSVQYAVATALLGRANDPMLYLRPTAEERARIDALTARSRVVVDPDADAAYPRASEGRVSVELADGSRHSEYRAAPPNRDPQAWRAKIGSAGDALLDEAVCDELAGCVAALADDASTAACLDAMTVAR
jgi:2-methylcitrate dehydratase PrpD